MQFLGRIFQATMPERFNAAPETTMIMNRHFKSDSHYQKRVAQRLSQIRQRTGLSQAAFAERIGYSTEGYRQYERNKTPLPQKAYVRILSEFGEDPYDVIREEFLEPKLLFDRSERPEFGRSFLDLTQRWNSRRKCLVHIYRAEEELSHHPFIRHMSFIGTQLYVSAVLLLGVVSFLEPNWLSDFELLEKSEG